MFSINREEEVNELLQKETINSLLRSFNNNHLFILIAATVSFLASFNTMNNIMGGWGANFQLDLNLLNWENGFNALIAAGMCIIIVKAQSSVFSKRTFGLLGIIVFIIIAVFNIGTETGNASNRAERGMRAASQETPSFKAAQRVATETNLNPTVAPSPMYLAAQREISMLEGKINRCEQIHEKPADQKWCARKPQKQLINAQANLEAAQAAALLQQQQMQQAAANQVAKAQADLKALEANEDYYHPLIKVVKNSLDTTGFNASIVTGLFLVIVVFIAFLFLGQEKETLKEAIRRLGYDTKGNPLTPPKETPNPPQKTKPEAPKPPQNQIKESNQIDLEDLVESGHMNQDHPTSEPKKPNQNQDLNHADKVSDLDDKVENDNKVNDKENHDEPKQDDKVLTQDQFMAVLKAIDLNQIKRFSYSSVGKVLKAVGASGDSATNRYLVEQVADGMMRDNIIITNPKFDHNEAGKGGGTSKWLINPDYKKQPNRWN